MATKTATATSKSTKVKAIPDGYHSVTPYLISGAAARLDFYKQAFGAMETVPHARARRQDRPRRDQDRRLRDHARRRAPRDGDARSPSALRRLAGQPHALRRGRGRRFNAGVAAGGTGRSRWPTSSTATAPARSRIPSATSGRSPPTRKTSAGRDEPPDGGDEERLAGGGGGLGRGDLRRGGFDEEGGGREGIIGERRGHRGDRGFRRMRMWRKGGVRGEGVGSCVVCSGRAGLVSIGDWKGAVER